MKKCKLLQGFLKLIVIDYTGPKKQYTVLGLRPGYSYVFWRAEYESSTTK